MSRPCGLWSFFPSALDFRVRSIGFFCRGILRLGSIIFNSPFEYDVLILTDFKRSFGLTSSLFILYVHELDRLWFGMLTVETAVIPGLYLITFVDFFNSSNCDRKGQSNPVEYYLESVEEYSEGKIYTSEPEWGNRNVNTVYFVNQARRNQSHGVCLRWTGTRLQMFTVKSLLTGTSIRRTPL